MHHATQHPQSYTELAKHAFANNGYVPSVAVLQATAKGLMRLADPWPTVAFSDADGSFDEMLRSCASV